MFVACCFTPDMISIEEEWRERKKWRIIENGSWREIYGRKKSFDRRRSLTTAIKSLIFIFLRLFLVPWVESDDNATLQRARRCWESLRARAQIARSWTDTLPGPQALPRSHQAGEQTRRITIPKGPHRHHGFGTESNEIIHSLAAVWTKAWKCERIVRECKRTWQSV